MYSFTYTTITVIRYYIYKYSPLNCKNNEWTDDQIVVVAVVFSSSSFAALLQKPYARVCVCVCVQCYQIDLNCINGNVHTLKRPVAIYASDEVKYLFSLF